MTCHSEREPTQLVARFAIVNVAPHARKEMGRKVTTSTDLEFS